ncbi:DUF86 domain-containing protein [Bacillus sp. JCM 19041]|uniref:DUF86 domain-containing protein n=1 Tax=Bacillus sp. JCM 19041 TaxID=1460637 RepID=UPI0006D1C858
MYFVDQQKIEQTLAHMESLLAFIKSESFTDVIKDQLAIERAGTVIIESIIDVGNQMIDGFIMRDPGGYEDIIDILQDEAVINEANARELKSVIRIRKSLAYEYTSLQGSEVLQVLKANNSSLEEFPGNIRVYLKNELGVITAFLPDSRGNE